MLAKICRYISVLLCSLLLLSGCGFHLKQTTEIPAQFKVMTLQSDDPYGPLARTLKQTLQQNKVKLLPEPTANYPELQILKSQLSKNTISVYPDGKAAEYQLILRVETQIVMPGEEIYPLTLKVFRSFFDNPATVLAKNAEQDLITKEMYQQAAEQLINKLKTVSVMQQHND